MRFRVALLAVDEGIIHPLTLKVKQKMKKIEKIFKRKKNFSENLVTERLQNGGNLLT